MMDTPLVTSILITYNHKNSIRQALDSMLAQKTTFKHKILIEDDCSTDGTTGICMEYAARFPDSIQFVPKKINLGIVGNIFNGISQVKSVFYATLEGDDYWCDEYKLQKQVDVLEKHPDCSFCGHNTLCKTGDGKEYPLFSKKKHKIQDKYEFPVSFRKKKFVKIHPSSRLYRTACLDIDRLKFKDSLVWDSSSYWYFLSKGKLYYLDQIMSVYNYNGLGVFSGSTSSRQRYMSILNTLNINEELDFKHNAIFMGRLLRHRRFLKLSLWTQLMLKHNLPRHLDKYHELKTIVENELKETGVDVKNK